MIQNKMTEQIEQVSIETLSGGSLIFSSKPSKKEKASRRQ